MLAPALVLSSIGLAVWGGAALSATAAIDPPVASLAGAGDVVLAGEDVTFSVSLGNDAPADGFNIGFTVLLPNGVAFESSPMGTPVVYASEATLPNSATTPSLATVPAGFQLWVFEDVADLPMGAEYASTVTVRPDAALFPVGAALHADLTGYVSSDPALRPIFDGSTGAGGAAGLAATSSDASAADVELQALRVTKSEPSAEDELLRGVHRSRTSYTLTIENTPQGTSEDVTVVDYLPAGLEFLGCGDVDNTAPSPLLDGTAEYPGAGSVAGAALPDCTEPDSVETVDTGLPSGLEPGVYTKVTWTIPALSGDAAQVYPTDAGAPGTTTLRYVAAVPLFENTMNFVTTGGNAAPSPASLGQAANLNNNNGPSTRQGEGAGFGDGRSYLNTAIVSADYGGPLTAGASAAVSASDTERIVAMDLRLLKTVDTGSGGDQFDTGRLATFRLELATSEYTSADRVTLVDTLPNGLCPAIPGSPAATGDPLPDECDPVSPSAGTPLLSGATVTGVDYDASTGTFAITFEPLAESIASGGVLTIAYTALMRSGYDDHQQWTGNTSSGDSFVNEVELDGWTTAIDALDEVTNGSGVQAGGEQDVWDDSSARITSDYSSISKRVLARDAVIPGPATAADACAVAPSNAAWAETLVDAADVAFHQGDLVCYELTVDFAEQIDVRNPVVTDFLPADVEYLDSTVYSGAGIEVAGPSRTGQRVEWTLGTVGADGDRYVPLGSTLVLHVLGTLTTMTSATATTLDKPENLMKYRQENAQADVFSERDASAIRAGQGPTLLKGVRDVDGATTLAARSQDAADGAQFGSNRDGIQVVGGDVVTYRIDLTGGDTDAALTVWDALPPGVTASDVTDPAGGVPLDPGDAGYPADSQDPTRSLVMWTDVAVAAGAQRSILYDVTVPADVRINATLGNTASITSYDVELNSGETRTFHPEGSLATGSHPDDEVVPGDGTRDDSAVYTPAASIDKSLVGSEVGPAAENLDPMNTDSVVVQGELVTYSYSVTIPAHTSVANGVLRDRGTLTRSSGGTAAFTVTGGSWTASALTGATASDFSFAAVPASGTPRGVLTFPGSYTNSSDVDQVFTVTLTGHVGDAGNNNITLTNQAQFTSATWNGDDTTKVTYREPNLDITKTAASPSGTSSVSVNDVVTYTLTVNNTNRVASYDNVVVDAVPAGLIVASGSITPAPTSFDPGITMGTGGTITWNIAQIPANATLSYTAQIDPTTGAAQSYLNTATVTGYTLPSTVDGESTTARRGQRTDTDSETITAATAGIDKGVRLVGQSSYGEIASAPIGETVEYQVVTTLRAGVNYYDPVITDHLPAGVQLDAASIVGPTPSDASIAGSWTRSHDSATNTWRWEYDGDIPSSMTERTLTLSYRVLLADTVEDGVSSLRNTAEFSWNRTNDTASSRTSITDDATVVTVLDPVLAIDKAVTNASPNPGDAFGYSVTVTNTGGTSAHNIVVTDTVPDGVIVDPDSISNGGTISGQTATGGGTITWDASDLPGPLHPQGSAESPTSIQLSYAATLAPSANLGDSETFTNTARVTHFESFSEGGRVYDPSNVTDTARVDPPFPNVTLDKSVTAGDVAYAGTPFGWTLRLANTGDGPAQTITVSDVLPKNWSYDAGSARITVGTGAQVALGDPSLTTVGGVQTLNWPSAQIAAATPALPGTASGATLAERTIVITFTATPSDDAITDAGTTTAGGVRVPHVNTLHAVTTDTSGATGNESGSYTAPDDTASAYIHAADLRVSKTGAASPLVAGTSGTGWTIVVTNDGPDPAVGPISVADTTGALPAGIVVTGASGTGWSCDSPSRDADGVTSFECARTNPGESLADGASFPAIEVAVQVAADQPAATVDNTAVVTPGVTYDPDSGDNEDADPLETTTSADLTIDKTVSSTAPNAGSAISWLIAPRNLGPSVSASTSGAPITISDTIPAGIGDVADPSTDDWTAAVTRDGDASTFPARAGDVITWTYQGTALVVGAAPTITLSGVIDASWTATSGPAADGSILNEARIAPGTTPDPTVPNNSSSVPVTPGDDTSLGITKTRVVWDDDTSTWVTAPGTVVPGDPVSYRITVVNNGPADARDVRVVDEVPSGLSYASHASESGTWARSAGGANEGGTTDADWDTFALSGTQQVGAANARSFIVTYDVDPALDPTAPVVNWAEASAENASNAPRDNDSGDQTRVADLSIVKSHTGDAIAGSTLDYRIVVTNEGPSSSSGTITITDTLPAGFSYVAGSAQVRVAGGASVQFEPTVSGQTLSWSLLTDAGASLPLGETIVIDLTSAIAPTVPAQTGLVNVAEVSGPEDDDATNNRDDDPTRVQTQADVAIVKDVAAGPWIAGTDVSYSLTVTGAGPSAVGAAVTDTLPTGMTLVSMSGAGWDCSTVEEGDRDGTCVYTANGGLHPVGAANATTITVVAHLASSVPDGTELTNAAEVDWTDSRGTHDDSDDAQITVTTRADLELVKTAIDEEGDEVASAVAGRQARYELVARNLGPSDAVGPLTIVDTLPAGVSYVALTATSAAGWAAVAGPADPTSGEQLVTFTRIPAGTGLAAAETAPAIVFDVTLSPDLDVPDSPRTNTATVSSGTPDANPANDTDDAQLDIRREVDVQIVKSHDPAQVRVGDELPFALEVTNNGPSVATGLTVTDTVPAGLEVLSLVGDPVGTGWTLVSVTPVDPDDVAGGAVVVASYADPLGPGAQAPTFTVTTRVTAGAYPEVVNLAEVAVTETDIDADNNSFRDTVSVPALVTLAIEKTATGLFQVGKTGTYTITVENTGPTDDPGPVTVEDVLPDGLTFASSPDDGVEVAGRTVTWTIPGIPTGDAIELTLTVNVDTEAFPSVTNVATVDTPSELTSDSVLESQAEVDVMAAPVLSLTGADVALPALLALVLLVLGGVAVVVARRRLA